MLASHVQKPSGSRPPVLTGDAEVGDVLTGKTFYKDDANTKLTGTAVFSTGDLSIITPLQAEISLTKSWNGLNWIHTSTIGMNKSWTIT